MSTTTKNTFYQVASFSGVQTETEKAVLVNVELVSPDGAAKIKGIQWFPKSSVVIKEDKLFVASWLEMKLKSKKAQGGYTPELSSKAVKI